MPPPVPAVGIPAGDENVLVTGERAELPPAVATLVDPAVPLPADVRLFEKRFSFKDAAVAGSWAIGLALLGLLGLAAGVIELLDRRNNATTHSGPSLWPVAFALTCAVGTWLGVQHAMASLRLRAAQQAGRTIRVGILLTPTALIECTATAWAIVPRARVARVAGGTIDYPLNGTTKTITLPAEFVGVDRAGVERAIAAWQSAGGFS